jgi:hypothetical protein
VAFPHFEVAEEDEDEGALRYAAHLSSGRDLVKEFIAYGVWPLAHGWTLGEVTPRQMPTLGGQLVKVLSSPWIFTVKTWSLLCVKLRSRP